MNAQTPVFAKIYGLVQQAERILLVADGSPDGDSIGSTSAFLNWLVREGKNVTAFCKEKLPRAMLYLDGSYRFTNDPHVFDQPYDLILTFDAGDLRHCGIDELLPKAPKTYTLVVFDHHNTNERFGDVNAVFTDACSTCEVVYRFFMENGVPIDDKMATSLLTGINTDTGSFQNSGTTVAGIDAAGHLFASGARHPDVLRNLIKNKSVDGLKLWGLGLERLTYIPELDLAVTYFRHEDFKEPGAEDAVDGVSNFLQGACAGADAILVLKEKPDGVVRGSMRSLSRDISIICKALGGGGHKKAAGFTLPGPLEIKNGRPSVIEKISNLNI